MLPLELANVGQWPTVVSQVTGSLPLKLASPKSSRPSATPPSMPGYQAITTALAFAYHCDMSTMPPASSTTIVGFPIAVTCLIRLSCVGDETLGSRLRTTL